MALSQYKNCNNKRLVVIMGKKGGGVDKRWNRRLGRWGLGSGMREKTGNLGKPVKMKTKPL